MSSFSLTQTILLKTSLSSSGSRFVLTFELHDSSLNGFLDTANFSSFPPLYSSCCSSLYVPAKSQFVVLCRGASFSPLLISCKDCLAHHHSSLSHPPFHPTARTSSLPHCPYLISTTPRTLDLVLDVRLFHKSHFLLSKRSLSQFVL